MARSPTSINAPSTVSTPSQPSIPTRTRTRKLSISTSTSTPSASVPSTPLASTPADGSSSSKLPKSLVEPKTHALRSVLGEKERTPCPFPGQYGGREKCGLTEEDERDETLMATCAACAIFDNRALSADEIASIAIDEGWLRPPSAAVIPATIINNAIRAHQRRCQIATPPRNCILAKHQLAGSVNELVLEAALHPDAFRGMARPKGTVWFLAQVGKTKWKNPFTGIDIPKAPPRKPGPPKKMPKEIRAKPAPSSGDDKEKRKVKPKTPIPSSAPVKLRLVLGGQSSNTNVNEDDAGSEAGSSSTGSRNASRQGSHAPIDIPTNASVPIMGRKPSRRMRNMLDSSDESESSDSDLEMDFSTTRIPKAGKMKKERPPPLPLANNTSRSAIPPLISRSLGSPYFDWKNLSPSPTLTTAILPQQPAPTNSPFPSHSLDNTTWAVRQNPDRFAAFEESSSSSDDEMRDPGDWGLASGILIRAADDGDDVKPIWSAEDEEAKVKEATDALRVLFPMSTPDEDMDESDEVVYNQLDNFRPAPSDTSSIADSATTATANLRGPLRSADLSASIALSTWNGTSSPILSPKFRGSALLVPDTSPTQHLSRLHNSFEAGDMEVDEEPWLDESGELPVKAEDTFSDDGLNSTIGDTASPEHDRQLHTAAWALEAAANTSFRVKEEIDDYPSPLTPEEDDVSVPRTSRASSSGSHTPSSRYSELPPFDGDHEGIFRPDLEEVLMGPESISVEELDGWLPSMAGRTEKTPQRGKHAKGRYQRDRFDSSRKSGNWGGIGVGCGAICGISPSTQDVPSTPARQRNTRSGVRRRSSTRAQVSERSGVDSLPTPPAEPLPEPEVVNGVDIDLEIDAFGPADFEAAKAEAEEREEKHRRACRAKAERQKELLEAYRQKVREGQFAGRPASDVTPPDGWEGVSPWSEGTWGTASTESINIATPGVLSPMALHSMSYLSLETPTGSVFYNSMDPKALLSPPLHPAHSHGQAGILDEVMSQQEVEALMPLLGHSPTPTVAHISPPPTASTTTTSAPIPIAPAPVPRPLAPPKQVHKLVPLQPTPIPVTPTSEAPSKTAIVDLPTSLPAEIAPQPAKPISTVSTAPAQLQAPTARVKTPLNRSDTPKSSVSPAATSTASSSSAPPATASVPTKSQGTITKPLCAGVDACVVDNIPVYAHVWEGKNGKQILLRRLDTDFVNATSLLAALGVPPAKHSEYLQPHSAWLASHHAVAAQCSKGGAYSPGVPGIWVQLAEARDFAKRLKLSESNLLSSILREDLFQLFAALASIKPDHQASETFGLPFVARRPNSVSQTTSAHSSTSSLTTSSASANSKSTPNLTSLSSAQPNPHGPGRFTQKNPLVRPAAQPQPDSCPQPKRRRATTCIAGELAPMARIIPAGAVGTNHSSVIKKPPPRATRASIAGDAVKPKMGK